eukprot:2794185-Rhodomonas_salina.2
MHICCMLQLRVFVTCISYAIQQAMLTPSWPVHRQCTAKTHSTMKKKKEKKKKKRKSREREKNKREKEGGVNGKQDARRRRR